MPPDGAETLARATGLLSLSPIVDGSTQWVIDPVVTWVELTHAADDEDETPGEPANRRCQFVATRRPQFEAKPCQLPTAAALLNRVGRILKTRLSRQMFDRKLDINWKPK